LADHRQQTQDNGQRQRVA